MLPTTGERAFVQVKSSTNQKQLNDYLERFAHRPGAADPYGSACRGCPTGF